MTGTLHQRPGDTLAALRPENVHPADGRGTNAGGEASQTAPWSLDQLPANVVPFVRARAGEAGKRLGPALPLDAAARPAPLAPAETRGQLAAFVLVSLVLHAGLYAAFWDEEPKPLASVGIESITVDIVLGGNTEAGVATTPGETEAQVSAPAEELKPEDEAVEQQEHTVEARPETPVAERELPANDVTEAKPERSPTTTAAPSDAASGIGRGRSDADTNYRGVVAAHLTRHKQYPADARRNREQGTATVSFAVDGSGRVTAASLVRGSGHASLDQEVQAMVRRASPFPPPPGGRRMSFTVPIIFRMQ
jgi:TonB family protein